MKRVISVVSFLVLALSLAAAQRLPEGARPENYKLKFTPDLDKATAGSVAAMPEPMRRELRDLGLL